MPIHVANRQLRERTLAKRYGAELTVLDLTSRGPEPWVRFSPFFPHEGIPVPFSPGVESASVEGIWQGLKVFVEHDVDPAKFAVRSMKGLKRTVRKFGPVRGHRQGVVGDALLPYGEARNAIYLPSYRWALENKLQVELAELKALCAERTVVLLDYETNTDVANLSKPLSHAGLVMHYVEGTWPGTLTPQ